MEAVVDLSAAGLVPGTNAAAGFSWAGASWAGFSWAGAGVGASSVLSAASSTVGVAVGLGPTTTLQNSSKETLTGGKRRLVR